MRPPASRSCLASSAYWSPHSPSAPCQSSFASSPSTTSSRRAMLPPLTAILPARPASFSSSLALAVSTAWPGSPTPPPTLGLWWWFLVGRGDFQKLDKVATVKPFSKFSAKATDISQIPKSLFKVLDQALSGRRLVLDLSNDILHQTVSLSEAESL